MSSEQALRVVVWLHNGVQMAIISQYQILLSWCDWLDYRVLTIFDKHFRTNNSDSLVANVQNCSPARILTKLRIKYFCLPLQECKNPVYTFIQTQ